MKHCIKYCLLLLLVGIGIAVSGCSAAGEKHAESPGQQETEEHEAGKGSACRGEENTQGKGRQWKDCLIKFSAEEIRSIFLSDQGDNEE